MSPPEVVFSEYKVGQVYEVRSQEPIMGVRGVCKRNILRITYVSPPSGSGDILFFPGRPSVCPSVCHKSCPLYNLKTTQAIFTKLNTNINQYEMTC